MRVYPRLDRICLADKTVMRDSWYVIFSLLSLAIGLALLLFVTLSAGPKPAGNLSQGSATSAVFLACRKHYSALLPETGGLP